MAARRLRRLDLLVLSLVLAFGARGIRAGGVSTPSPQVIAIAAKPVLSTDGTWFRDPAGRVVVLRGVNLAGNAKVPPFLPVRDLSDLDPLPALGVNVIRLVFIWEAYEPSPGVYDELYLDRLRTIAAAAWEREIHTIVDIHQDGYARYVSRGAGDGFPLWAVSPRARATTPRNGPRSKHWPVLMASDPGTYRSFSDFYADTYGVRTRYLVMLHRIASAFAPIPGVIGYDPMNEPWGDERRELAPLYRDACDAIRSADPAAILFLEGHITTNAGARSRLPRPSFGNVAYAPHYYQPTMIARNAWGGRTAPIDRAFGLMEGKAAEWCSPLFVGEFGAPADADNAGVYVESVYDRLDETLASGTQWNFTPGWDPHARDGWNGEDFNILDPTGRPRPNHVARPYPRAIAGEPLHFHYARAADPRGAPALVFVWEHDPERGVTEVFVPSCLFPPASDLIVDGPPGLTCWFDARRQLLMCRSPLAGRVRVQLKARSPVVPVER